jgi:hypothetical protein
MTRIIFLVSIFISFFNPIPIFGSSDDSHTSIYNQLNIPDSLRDRQFLYNGTEWENAFRRITGDQFLFTNTFLPGSVTFNGRTFVNIELRYDIYSDEIMIPRSLDQIILLNKEMVDSFYFVFNNNLYKFKKILDDSGSEPEGYVNVLYEGRSALYIKYVKRISTSISDYSDGKFYQVYTIYFAKDGIPVQVKRMKDIYRLLENERDHIRKYIKENKLKVTRKIPESFVPVIRFYDGLRK